MVFPEYIFYDDMIKVDPVVNGPTYVWMCGLLRPWAWTCYLDDDERFRPEISYEILR